MLVEKRCVYHLCWFYTLFSVSKEVHTAFISNWAEDNNQHSEGFIPIEELVYVCSCFFDAVLFKHHSVSGHNKNWAPEKQLPLFEKPRLASRRTLPGKLPCLTFSWGSQSPWNYFSHFNTIKLIPTCNQHPVTLLCLWPWALCSSRLLFWLAQMSYTEHELSDFLKIYLKWQVSISHLLL